MATNKNEHLKSVLDSYKMTLINEKLNKFKEKKKEIKEKLIEKYGSGVYYIFNSGSYAKDTSINTKFDIDIVVPFKRNTFDTIEDMFNDVLGYLSKEYEGVAKVRPQKVSVGVTFPQDDEGIIVSVDVVPGREILKDSYSETRDLNIYFKEPAWGFEKGTYTKTNIESQIEHIKNTGDDVEDVRNIIRLLKIWKTNFGEEYKSFFLELITIKAFSRLDITGNKWEKLKTVMTYIKDNVAKEGFSLKDPGNSNNNVAESLSKGQRSSLATTMDTIIENIESKSDNIKYYFPINDNHGEDKKAKYGIKGIGTSAGAGTFDLSSNRFG